jgi:hypothetical protein
MALDIVEEPTIPMVPAPTKLGADQPAQHGLVSKEREEHVAFVWHSICSITPYLPHAFGRSPVYIAFLVPKSQVLDYQH